MEDTDKDKLNATKLYIYEQIADNDRQLKFYITKDAESAIAALCSIKIDEKNEQQRAAYQKVYDYLNYMKSGDYKKSYNGYGESHAVSNEILKTVFNKMR